MSSDSTAATTARITVPGNEKLVDIFVVPALESDEESGTTTNFSSPSGSPQLTVRDPSLSTLYGFIDADVWIGAAGATAGSYTACCGSFSNLSAGFHLLLQPMPSWVAQWWSIGVDAQLGTVNFFNRIGGWGIGIDGLEANAIDPSIAVNNSGDVLVGFSSIPGNGYYSSAYVLKSHSSASQDTPYVYQAGGGRYTNPAGGETRPGDYSHTSVDPNDDNTLWTNVGYAGSHLTTSTGYSFWGWATSWALVMP